MLFDAHNHLQDERLWPHRKAIAAALEVEPIGAMVVNGTCEGDWPGVLALAREDSRVLPAFGCHPWRVGQRSPQWREHLLGCLDEAAKLGPRRCGGIGEIGLDRWMRGADRPAQEEAFVWQLSLAAERHLPASIHCLQAWGALLDVLRRGPLPGRGFLLHSFGGPRELISELAELGAYFSLPGYFARENKARQREAFRSVPPERLLLETDAPDQPLPAERVQYPLPAEAGTALNSPGNLRAVYIFAAETLGVPASRLEDQVRQNFERLFFDSVRVPQPGTIP